MTDELLGEFAENVSGWTLLPSGGGAFEMSINGDLAFSRLKEGRYPEMSELRDLIKAAL